MEIIFSKAREKAIKREIRKGVSELKQSGAEVYQSLKSLKVYEFYVSILNKLREGDLKAYLEKDNILLAGDAVGIAQYEVDGRGKYYHFDGRKSAFDFSKEVVLPKTEQKNLKTKCFIDDDDEIEFI